MIFQAIELYLNADFHENNPVFYFNAVGEFPQTF